MANNQPTVPEVDKELEDLKSKVPGLEDQPEESPEDDKSEEKPKEDEPEQGKKPDTKTDESADDDDKSDDEDEDEEESKSNKTSRPEKYIPIKQYTSEKKQWHETESQYKTRISELEAATAGKDGTKKTEDAIKAYAEKYGVDEEQIRELRGVFEPKENKPETKAETKISPEDQAVIDRSKEIVAEKMFTEEFETLAVPEIKSYFPNATPEQLKQAKKEMEKIATAKGNLDKSLDYLVYKNKADLAKIFTESRKGPEGQRLAPDHGKSTYVASDFVGGKTPFSTLVELPSEEQAKIVDQMDLKTYEKFTNWINQNDILAINRKGRKLKD